MDLHLPEKAGLEFEVALGKECGFRLIRRRGKNHKARRNLSRGLMARICAAYMAIASG